MYPVTLVSLGPGDPELITLKGLRTLQEADCIFCPETATRQGAPACSRAAHILAQLHIPDNKIERFHLPMSKDRQQAMAAYQSLKLTPTVGASGAIYGVLMGYAMLYPDSVLTLLFPPVSLKAKWFVIIFAVIELVTGVFSIGGGIAHFAHLGGLLFGWLLILYWKKKGRLY